jgi:hypothetical protein
MSKSQKVIDLEKQAEELARKLSSKTIGFSAEDYKSLSREVVEKTAIGVPSKSADQKTR